MVYITGHKFSFDSRTNPLASSSSTNEEFHDALRPITMEDLTQSLKRMKDSKLYCSNPLQQIALD